jgi:hypothetical protein
MAQQYRPHHRPQLYGRDRYQTGSERRYSADWDQRAEYGGGGERQPYEDRAYEDNRSYFSGGYPEEFGHRREPRDYRAPGAYAEGVRRDERSNQNYAGRPQPSYGRGEFNPEQERGYGEWSSPLNWRDQSDDSGFFGTGHLGGSSGSAAGTRALGGAFGGPGDTDFYGRGISEPQESWQRQREGERGPERSQARSDYRRQSLRYDPPGIASYGPRTDYERGWQRAEPRRSEGYGAGSYGPENDDLVAYRADSQAASFRGRGPKGYRRSDDRLKEMICEDLMEDPDIDASEISIEVADQVVTLTGTVEDRSTKYEIEELIESLGGVKDINNQLRVQSRPGIQGYAAQQRGQQSVSVSSALGNSVGSRGAEKSSSSGTGTNATAGTPISPSGKHN